MLYKLSNGRWSTVGDAAIYNVQTAGLAKRGYWVTESTTCDCVILSGGGTLYQPSNQINKNFMGIPCNMHFKDIAECLYNQDIPFYVLGAGCQQFNEDLVTRTSWRDLLEMATGISVRDNWSKNKLINDLQLNSSFIDRISVYPDPVFELYQTDQLIPVCAENIMISARHETVQKLLPTLEQLRQFFQLVWCPMDETDYQYYKSILQIPDIIQVSQFHGRYFPDYRLYINTLQNCFVNISDRLHAFLFSLIIGRGIVSLKGTQNQKVYGQIANFFSQDNPYPFICSQNDSEEFDSAQIIDFVNQIKLSTSWIERLFCTLASEAKTNAIKHYNILTKD